MNNTQEKWFERLKEMAELEIQNDELRTSLDELEKSRTRFSRLFDMALAGYIILDEAGRGTRIMVFCRWQTRQTGSCPIKGKLMKCERKNTHDR